MSGGLLSGVDRPPYCHLRCSPVIFYYQAGEGGQGYIDDPRFSAILISSFLRA